MGTELSSTNPLTKFFRQPSIYLKLPSNGRWWEDGSLAMPVTGELPIYPMTTRDEVILRTPDALLNGQGVVDVIQSCCPNIKDAWKMPSIDVDAVLISIRVATYGNKMDFTSTCPHCKETNDHEIELNGLLSRLVCPDYSKPVLYQSLKIKLHPQQYFTVNRANQIQFEEQRLVNVLNLGDDVDPEIKAQRLTESMTRLVELGTMAIVESTEYIETEDGDRITKKEHLAEFFQNAESSVIRGIQDTLGEIGKDAKIPPATLHCTGCDRDYEVELTFDYANFFGKGF